MRFSAPTALPAGADPVENNVAVALRPGDRIHVGAWTTITFHGAS
jgi:hypothetical protein